MKELCDRYGVGEHTVLGWVKNGELKALNVGRKLGRRPKYRFTIDAITAFEQLRSSSVPAAHPNVPRRTKREANVIEFIR